MQHPIPDAVPPSLYEIGEVSSMVGNLEDARGVYRVLSVRSVHLKPPHRHALVSLLDFVSSTRGNRIVSTKGKRDKDHDFLVRECIVCFMRPDLYADPSVCDPMVITADPPHDVDYGAALPVYVYDQHCMKPMRAHPAYFAACSSVTYRVVQGGDPYRRAAYRKYLESKGVGSDLADTLVAFAAGEIAAPPEIPHPLLQPPEACQQVGHRSELSAARTKRPRESEAAPAAPKRPAIEGRPTRLGKYVVQKNAAGRYLHGMVRGRKAPTLRALADTGDVVIIKPFKTEAEAAYAVWAYEVLNALGLATPGHVRLEALPFDHALLSTVADCEDQVTTWSKWLLKERIPCMVCDAVGDKDFRKLQEADVDDAALLRELAHVLIVRRAILQSSDLCTSNLRILHGRVYSIDHNRTANPEFIGRKLSRKVREALAAEIHKPVYHEFIERCQQLYPQDWDPSFTTVS